MSSKSEIESLLFLLDDPDDFVRKTVLDRFASMTHQHVPLLDEFRAKTKDASTKRILDETILKLTFPSIEHEFLNLLETGVTTYEELEAAALILCRVQNPTIREEIYIRKLNYMASEIQAEILYTLQPVKQMELLIYHIFHTHGFGPPEQPAFQANEVQLCGVMDTKKGIPLSLSLVVLFLARRLDLPFSGVNMPIHFMMRYDFDAQVVYLDPYNGGRPVSLEECLNFLRKNNIRPEQEYFNKSTPLQMLVRTLRNLFNAYDTANDPYRKSLVEILLTHIELFNQGME
jgi:regulator of sirC expression with transglutaminase-like and TPR domain